MFGKIILALSALAWASAQIPNLGFCPEYIPMANFNRQRVSNLNVSLANLRMYYRTYSVYFIFFYYFILFVEHLILCIFVEYTLITAMFHYQTNIREIKFSLVLQNICAMNDLIFLQFMGIWYEAERYFQLSEVVSRCVMSNYTRGADGKYRVSNEVTNRL